MNLQITDKQYKELIAILKEEAEFQTVKSDTKTMLLDKKRNSLVTDNGKPVEVMVKNEESTNEKTIEEKNYYMTDPDMADDLTQFIKLNELFNDLEITDTEGNKCDVIFDKVLAHGSKYLFFMFLNKGGEKERISFSYIPESSEIKPMGNMRGYTFSHNSNQVINDAIEMFFK